MHLYEDVPDHQRQNASRLTVRSVAEESLGGRKSDAPKTYLLVTSKALCKSGSDEIEFDPEFADRIPREGAHTLTTYCLLHTNHYLLPTTYYLLPTTHYPLPTTRRNKHQPYRPNVQSGERQLSATSQTGSARRVRGGRDGVGARGETSASRQKSPPLPDEAQPTSLFSSAGRTGAEQAPFPCQVYAETPPPTQKSHSPPPASVCREQQGSAIAP